MSRALVVHHNPFTAERAAAALRSLGFDVERCAGPDRNACPVVDGRACLRAERADFFVYDLRSLRHAQDDRELVDELRALYADKPIVVIYDDSESGSLAPVEMGEGVVRLHGPLAASSLDLAVEDALADR